MKLNFQQINETKINWYQLGKLKEKKTEQNRTKQKQQQTEKKIKNENMCIE